ncbi:DNA gyrase C-terminal beta-propeller domain-containing protein, partial [Streptococcus suis]
MGTKFGYTVRFTETAVRGMSRIATGVKGITLRDGDQVVGATMISDDQEVLVLSEKGFGKRTLASEYPTKGRGGKGIITMKVAEKNGPLAGLITVSGTED